MFTQPSALKSLLIFSTFLFMISMVSCTDANKPAKYRLYFRGDNHHKEQVIELDDLSKGFANLSESGIALSEDIYYDFYYHKGVYYDIDLPDKMKKYCIKNREILFQDSCIIKNMTEVETHCFVDDTTLLVVGLDLERRNPVYAIINTQSFQVEQEGDIPIPDDASYERTSIGFAEVKDKTFFMTYVYHNLSERSYTTFPSISLIALNYPEMTFRHNSINEKSTYQPVNGRHQPTMTKDESGTIFFITNTSEAFAKMPNMPSGISKVDMTTEKFDPDFFINISDSLKDCYPVAIWHISESSFLLKCERHDLVKGWHDYLNKKVFEYYCINIANGTLHKLDLPLDSPWYTNNVIVDGGIAYIAHNGQDGYTFQLFDPKDNSLREGLKIDSSVKRIFSIDFN